MPEIQAFLAACILKCLCSTYSRKQRVVRIGCHILFICPDKSGICCVSKFCVSTVYTKTLNKQFQEFVQTTWWTHSILIQTSYFNPLCKTLTLLKISAIKKTILLHERVFVQFEICMLCLLNIWFSDRKQNERLLVWFLN